LLAAELDVVFRDDADRSRHAAERTLEHRGGDDDLFQRILGVASRRLSERRRADK
jgi:hypothetical protein